MSERTKPLTTTFVETHLFTKRIVRLGLEQPLRELQIELAVNPTAGDVDPGTGGLRKVRVADPGRGTGKRGGARVHYLWVPSRKLIYLNSCGSVGENIGSSNGRQALYRTYGVG